MISPNNRGYSQDSSSNPPLASDYFDQYFEATQSLFSGLGSTGSQSEESSIDAGLDPKWFTDSIEYPDEPDIQADPKCVSPTSGSMRMDLTNDMVTIPPLTSSLVPVDTLNNTIVPIDNFVCEWPYSTVLDDASFAMAFGSDMLNYQWNLTEPAIETSDQYASSHSDSSPSEDSEQSSLEDSNPTQNDSTGKISVSRMPYFKCPMCSSQYASELRLSKHLQRSHVPARFTCVSCNRGFTQEKDLIRHQSIHEPLSQQFACSCRRTFSRYDSLLRHFKTVAKRPREAGRHKAVESKTR